MHLCDLKHIVALEYNTIISEKIYLYFKGNSYEIIL
jgi:hypothetical protein